MSASQIKIMEPGAVAVGANGAPGPGGGENERLVVITGQPANIQMAVQLLYHVSYFLSMSVPERELKFLPSVWNRKSKSSCALLEVGFAACVYFDSLHVLCLSLYLS